MRKIGRRLGISLVIGLAMQFPGGHGYAPVARALWALAMEEPGHGGHGPRWAWTAATLAVLLVYTCAAFLLLSSISWFVKRMRPRE